jgi:hypothetical protein
MNLIFRGDFFAITAHLLCMSVVLAEAPTTANLLNRTVNTISSTPYKVSANKNGEDLGASWVISSIRYFKEGIAHSTFVNGVTIESSWTIDDSGKFMTINSYGYAEARWEILEITSKRLRMRNLISGIEMVHTAQ